MAFFSDTAQAVLEEYQSRILLVAIRVYRNSRLSSSEQIVVALEESFASIQTSIIRFASQQNPLMPVQFSMNVAWQDDLPLGVNIATISKNTFLGDLTNLTYVSKENIGEVLRLLKERGGKDTLFVTLDDAPSKGLADLKSAQGMGSSNPLEKGKKERKNPEDAVQAFNPSVLLGGMFAAQRRGSEKAKMQSTRDNSPRRRQGSTGWVDDNETYPRDPYDRSLTNEVSMPNKAKPETHQGDQRSESARDEDHPQVRNNEARQAKPGSITKKSDSPPPSVDLDENVHESRRHLFGPRH